MEPPVPRTLASPTSPAPPLSSPPNVPPLSKIPSSSPRRIVEDSDQLSRTPPGSSPSPKPKDSELCGSPATMMKRRLLEAGDEEVSPYKRAKPLLTSASVRRKPEVEDLHAWRVRELTRVTRATFAAHVQYQRLRKKELEIIQAMADFEEAEEFLGCTKDLHARRRLELARATRTTFAANVEYQRLRKEELEIIQAMAGDDFEEAQEFSREAELQAGHIKSASLDLNGVVFDRDNIDQCSDADSSDGRGSSLPHCRLFSPSTNTSSDL